MGALELPAMLLTCVEPIFLYTYEVLTRLVVVRTAASAQATENSTYSTVGADLLIVGEQWLVRAAETQPQEPGSSLAPHTGRAAGIGPRAAYL